MHYYTSPIDDFVFSFHYEIGKILQGGIHFSQVKCPEYISVEIVPSRLTVPGGGGGSSQELFNPLAGPLKDSPILAYFQEDSKRKRKGSFFLGLWW